MAAIKLKQLEFKKLQGDLSDADFSMILGVDKTLLWKIRHGKSSPGGRFVASVLLKFPKKRFEDIFMVER